MNWVLRVTAEAWQWMRDIGAVLRPCRFSVLVVIAGAALLASPQGREVTVGISSEHARGWTVAAFHLAVFLWAFQSWYWARVTLDFAFGPDRGARLEHPRSARIQTYIRRAPRVIAAATYLVAIATAWGYWKNMVGLALAAVLFNWFLVHRRDLTQRLASRLGAGEGSRAHEMLLKQTETGKLRSQPKLSLLIMAATLLAYPALLVWVSLDAVGFGWLFGAAAVAFIGFSIIAAVGSMLVLLTREGGARRTATPTDSTALGISPGYPVVRTLFLIAVVWSFCPFVDNHGVRTVSEPPRPGKDLEAALKEWYEQAPAGTDGRKNFIVVAAAGGGLRAAYWTATVLGAAQDHAPDFRRQLVAVSGVSGGSLGALTFVTLLAQEKLPDNSAKCARGPVPRGAYECAGQAVLSQDFLAPTAAALLFPDTLHRFVPLGFADRARALEQSWERSWRLAGFRDEPWSARGFRALWPEGRHLPALLLNGTHVETGKRVLTSHIDVGARPDTFLNTYDFYRLSPDKDIRPSTAAHNSARFTFVSPASRLPDRTHLVDGGYFENFGAITARELIDAALYQFTTEKIRPVAIVISNDPALRAEDFPSKRTKYPPAPPRQLAWGSEVMSPLRTLLHTRDARGLLAAADLRATVEYYEGRYFELRLCKDAAGRADPALGWVLSEESQDLMREQLARACDNDKQFAALLKLVGAANGPTGR
jgi:hypothetical protein